MLLWRYFRTYAGMRSENLFHRIAFLFLAVTVFILAFLLIRKERIVVLTPYTQSSQAWVATSDGSRSYMEAWALFFAQELGNITPANIDFIRDRIGSLISPSIYKDFMEALSQQALRIKEDRLVLRFDPNAVEFEEETGKIFVTGRLFTRAFNERETSEMRTYEFIIRLSSYAPELLWMDTYADPPHTRKFLRSRRSRDSK
ncbi:MAG: pilus assembly protein [Succinivibrionaceae bacterium]|nr:pilus assembly protein [Succinivibrionaceae bacterium]